jgi:hypothetical protein
MANDTAHLLIKISADPANAEESIRKFQTSFHGHLTDVGLNLSEWARHNRTSFTAVTAALENMSGNG